VLILTSYYFIFFIPGIVLEDN